MEDKRFSFWWNRIQVMCVGTLLLPPAVWASQSDFLPKSRWSRGQGRVLSVETLDSSCPPGGPGLPWLGQIALTVCTLGTLWGKQYFTSVFFLPPNTKQNKQTKANLVWKKIRQFPTKGPSIKCLVSTPQNWEGHWNHRRSETWSQLMRLRMAPRERRMLEKSSGRLNNKIQQYRFCACGKGAALTSDAKIGGSGGWV